MTITKFRGKYAFLSNFYIAPFVYEGIRYTNSEAAFQAQKSLDIECRKKFSSLDGKQAKALGRKIVLRPDWEDVKIAVMYRVLVAKFDQNRHLLNLLLETGDAELIEGNTWGDTFWGVNSYTYEGKNTLGLILMNIRDRVKFE